MKVIVCDDDRRIQEEYSANLTQLAEKHGVDIELLCYDNGEMLLFDFESPGFFADVIFLDVNMPGMTGDEVAYRLRECGYKNDIVFLTTSGERFLQAFDVGELRYLVKGEVTMQDFESVFLRAVRTADEKNADYVLFVAGGEYRNISVDAIKYFEVYKKIITVHYDNGSFEFYSNLDKLEKQLERFGFFRPHKSCLVALDQVQNLTEKELVLRDGKRVPVSRRNFGTVKEALRPCVGSQ